MPRAAHVFNTIGFLLVISSAGLVQTAAELYRGERPQALDLFRQAPTAENLRAFEGNLQDESLVAKQLRPWAQFALFALLDDAGEKALVGRGDWLFYRPGVQYLTERPATKTAAAGPHDPMPAIRAFRDQLAARGIRLLVMPVPNKESIYPEMLSRRAEGLGVFVGQETRALLDRLRAEGIETIDLFEEFRRAKASSPRPPAGEGPGVRVADRQRNADPPGLYLAQDSHWSPEGMKLAANAVARRVIERDWLGYGATPYDQRPAPLRRFGDVLLMLRLPKLQWIAQPEEVACVQVVQPSAGSLYRDANEAQVLVLGDSFLRIYQQDEPRAAGFIAHLARELKQPLASLVSDGGASTLVRQELNRRSGLLANKKLVIWEFVERDIRYGAEGWQVIPLPAEVASQEKTSTKGRPSDAQTGN